MTVSRILVGLALAMSLSTSATQASADENRAAVVAEVSGHKLTRAELEQKHAAKLLQARYQHYIAEREALDQLIEEQLLEMQAHREQVSVEQLLKREVTSRVQDPTEDQLQVFYEGLKTDEPFTAVRDKIVATPRQVPLAQARCAGEQGRFWEFHDVLFDNYQRLELAQLKAYARVLKLDAARFDQCLDAGEQAVAVQKDLAQAQRLGLTGTPSLLINGSFLSGAVRYSTLREIVEQQLMAPRSAAKECAGSIVSAFLRQ